LTLIDHRKNDFGIKGYLKCDLFMFYESNNNLWLSKPLYSMHDDNEINEKCVPIYYIVILGVGALIFVNNILWTFLVIYLFQMDLKWKHLI